ncbi:hypothetical protein HDU91_000631, partial [Kappamyces sp. JEL0680]
MLLSLAIHPLLTVGWVQESNTTASTNTLLSCILFTCFKHLGLLLLIKSGLVDPWPCASDWSLYDQSCFDDGAQRHVLLAQACENLKKACELETQDINLNTLLASLYFYLDENQPGIQLLQQTAQLPNLLILDQIRVFTLLARAWMSCGFYEEAYTWSCKALELQSASGTKLSRVQDWIEEATQIKSLVVHEILDSKSNLRLLDTNIPLVDLFQAEPLPMNGAAIRLWKQRDRLVRNEKQVFVIDAFSPDLVQTHTLASLARLFMVNFCGVFGVVPGASYKKEMEDCILDSRGVLIEFKIGYDWSDSESMDQGSPVASGAPEEEMAPAAEEGPQDTVQPTLDQDTEPNDTQPDESMQEPGGSAQSKAGVGKRKRKAHEGDKRTSSRKKGQTTSAAEQPQPEENGSTVEWEDLSSINMFLGLGFQFAADGSLSPKSRLSVNAKQLIHQVSTDMLLKSGRQNPWLRRRAGFPLKLEWWNPMEPTRFFSDSALALEWVETIQLELQCTTLAHLLLRLAVFAIERRADYGWCWEQACITTMIFQMVDAYTVPVQTLFARECVECVYFASPKQALSSLLFTVEVLFDGLMDRNGSLMPDVEDEIVPNSEKSSILLSSSRKSLFERLLELLVSLGGDLPHDEHLRLLWIQARKDEVFSSPS